MNRQNLPQAISPINGDVESSIGSPDVVVTGIQQTPVSSTPPQDGQVYVYVAELGMWVAADPIVSGPNAPGTTPTANPVQVAGIDDSNLVREIRTDSYGSLRALNQEEKLDQIIYLLRALLAATVADKQVDDSEFATDNFTDIPAGA